MAGASGTTVLQFGKNDIGDAGVVAIADLLRANSTVTEVQLHNNSITDEGVATICEALADNTSVVKLDLSHNSLGPTAVQHIHKAKKRDMNLFCFLIFFRQLLSVNRTIRTVDVSGNEEIVEGAKLAACLQNGSLTLSSLAFTRNM